MKYLIVLTVVLLTGCIEDFTIEGWGFEQFSEYTTTDEDVVIAVRNDYESVDCGEFDLEIFNGHLVGDIYKEQLAHLVPGESISITCYSGEDVAQMGKVTVVHDELPILYDQNLSYNQGDRLKISMEGEYLLGGEYWIDNAPDGVYINSSSGYITGEYCGSFTVYVDTVTGQDSAIINTGC